MKLPLTLACGLYDRTLPLYDGAVTVEGVDLNFVPMEPPELFRRQARHAEFDAAEFSLATYTILYAQGDRRMVALPVFPSRHFRHGDIYVNAHAGIHEPKDLIGKRVGTMEYQQTAAVWMRALLQHDYGVRPDQIEWYFGGYYAPERYAERVPVDLPPGLRHHTIADQQSLDQLLDAGEIQGLMGAGAPPSFVRGSPNVARLFPDYPQREREYYRRTGIFPIMHTLVVKRDVYERAPWLAGALLKAFYQAKALGYRRLARHGTLYAGLPWLHAHLEELREVMGPDPFAYGLEENRKLLDTLLQHLLEQGLIPRALTPDELFAPETHEGIDPSVG
ncbi:MAG TPA: ABC transporter substrate-binding protein [Chloroflexota bacterium]|jgi:4,5-dihydroxyphthalate decarboxylase